ncbi:response regulator [Oxalicibacterium faecigallinarum]|uniref:response regulator n=1 Tax=Oxalicibacterium faecigallinarum TaxID=573741 RepID=UPI00166C4F19|nr:response regulator [Oxalicibacterium faecigallinarum]
MSSHSFPFAVRLLGFTRQETDVFDATFAVEQQGHRYMQLHEDNLQDPDLYIADAASLKALVTLEQLRPSDVRPALLVGEPPVALPYARVERPIRWQQLVEVLDKLIETRADALSRLQASDIVTVTERRRSNRVDIDLTDPADYLKMRTKRSQGRTVLIVDQSPQLYDWIAAMFAQAPVRILLADTMSAVEQACVLHPVATVIVNTTAAGMDPYAVCDLVTQNRAHDERIAVIFLSARDMTFDAERARVSGYDGFLSMPVSKTNLTIALQRFMHLPR